MLFLLSRRCNRSDFDYERSDQMVIETDVYSEDKKEYVKEKVKLGFINAKSFQFQRGLYGTVSILLDLVVTKKNDMFEK